MDTLLIVLVILSPMKRDTVATETTHFEKDFKEASEAAMRQALRKTEKERKTLYLINDKQKF